jgi:hypothetical protein
VRSGLGLEAQQKAVRDHLNGGNWKVVGEFTEVETGKRADRPVDCKGRILRFLPRSIFDVIASVRADLRRA